MLMLAVAVKPEPRHDYMVQQDDPERLERFADVECDGVVIAGRQKGSAGMVVAEDDRMRAADQC